MYIMLNTLPYYVFNLILEFTNTFNLKIVNKYCKENVFHFFHKKNNLLNEFMMLYKCSKKFNINDQRFFINQFPYCSFCGLLCHKLIIVEFNQINDSYLVLLKIVNPICSSCYSIYNNTVYNCIDDKFVKFINNYIRYFNIGKIINMQSFKIHFIDFINFFDDFNYLNIDYLNLIGSNYHIVYPDKNIKKNRLHNI